MTSKKMLHQNGKIPLIAAVKYPNQRKLSYDTTQYIANGQYHDVRTMKTDRMPWQKFYRQQGSRVMIENGKIMGFPGPRNEFYCLETNGKGMAIYLGTEPETKHEDYAKDLITTASKLGIGSIIFLDESISPIVPHTREAYYYYGCGLNTSDDTRLCPLNEDRENGGVCPMVMLHAQNQGIEAIGLEIVVPEYMIGHAYAKNYPYMQRLAHMAHKLSGMPINPSFLDNEVTEYHNRYIAQMMSDIDARAHIAEMEYQFDRAWGRNNTEQHILLSPEIEQFLNELQHPPDC